MAEEVYNQPIPVLPGADNYLFEESIRIVEASDNAKAWWVKFKEENAQQPSVVESVLRHLKERSASLEEFFLAFVFSDTYTIPAVFSFLDAVLASHPVNRPLSRTDFEHLKSIKLERPPLLAASQHADEIGQGHFPDPYKTLEDSTLATTREWLAAHRRYAVAQIENFWNRAIDREQFNKSLVKEKKVDVLGPAGGCCFLLQSSTSSIEVTTATKPDGLYEKILDLSHCVGTVPMTCLIQEGRYLAVFQNDGSNLASHMFRTDGSGKCERVVRNIDSTAACGGNAGLYYLKRCPKSEKLDVWLAAADQDETGDYLMGQIEVGPNETIHLKLSPDQSLLAIATYCFEDRHASITIFNLSGPGTAATLKSKAGWIHCLGFIDSKIILGMTDYYTESGKGVIRIVEWEPKGSEIPVELFRINGEYLRSGFALNESIILSSSDGLLENARQYDFAGKVLKDLLKNPFGTVRVSECSETEIFIRTRSPITPAEVQIYNLETQSQKLISTTDFGIDFSKFEILETSYQSHDGAEIPAIVCQRRDRDKSIPHPCIIDVYGGYGSEPPVAFNSTWAYWAHLGGTIVLPAIRGGGPGTDWHDAGRGQNKANGIGDYISCAEWLISSGQTKRSKLGAMGVSHGGLIVAAGMVKRPELLRACIISSAPLDMVRYRHYLDLMEMAEEEKECRTKEYGSLIDPADFKAIASYSPYSNLQPAHYPAVMIRAGEDDNVVHPSHSYKFFAALERAQLGAVKPLLVANLKGTHYSDDAFATFSFFYGELFED